MASILRSIVAGPRIKHPETGLDLVYVTDNSLSSECILCRFIGTDGRANTTPQSVKTVIAMSMPAAQGAKVYYRNPLSRVVEFLDKEHGENWAVWEFRAEGTGYEDAMFHNRVFHSPWPDHHPPPFGLIPNIMASMRNHLKSGEKKVAVVHCKAGKGRTGTVTCSYLISEENWTKQDALDRFTKKRMRPQFGAGVSIPSQLRYVDYVSQWVSPKYNKIYLERSVEVTEVHVWGLRENVKIAILGYVDEGKTIKNFHNFSKSERTVVDASEEGNSLCVIYKPAERVIVPTNDICIDLEKRTRAAVGWTFVSALSHCWFNCYFEGEGASSGVFSQEWDKMDGLKGTLRKGVRIFDKIQIVWKVVEESVEKRIEEPKPNEPVAGTQQAEEERGETADMDPLSNRDLGLRPQATGEDGDSEMASNTGSLTSSVRNLVIGGQGEGEEMDSKSDISPEDSVSKQGSGSTIHQTGSIPSIISPSTTDWTTSGSSADTRTYASTNEASGVSPITRVLSPESMDDEGPAMASDAPHHIKSTGSGSSNLVSSEPRRDALLHIKLGELRHDSENEMAS